ncbi:heat-inducible protein [Kosakonia radicincitans DSM 16656]|uniref:heat shock protein HslJ n=1 Tax=Kosakonia TaxID=1330547 RepID=UPI000272F58B|nr:MULTISPECIES: heat shock protein HslJ [Kosakonia]ARD60668.1 heat-inducible protein [Kosakonia radicincitans DSM 16656]KDE38004.1 heat-inducible protein [Kosakonia radicincitans UMEnt01/12]NCF06613.1 heat shock protein HslJ [Kosakonia sp. MH5]PTA92029.1 heat shock protein HslJ [Kosakonia sp. H7A]QEM91475.1 heat shock protein HslJ [Kosakonia radicincitans]
MKKIIPLIALSIALSACVSSRTDTLKPEQLANQRFVLTTFNGKALTTSDQSPAPEIRFDKDLRVSGKMCNGFMGQGKLSDGALTVKHMGMTMMMCADPQRNELDHTIQGMLSDGAQIDLTGDQLTLATASQTLIYTRANNAQ